MGQAEHQHLWQKDDVLGVVIAVNKCGCGAIICSSPSPDGMYDCNQEIGHPGSCKNTFHPGAGTWREKPKDPPMKIVVTRQGDEYLARLEELVEPYAIGKTRDEAIGKLIIRLINNEMLNIAIEAE